MVWEVTGIAGIRHDGGMRTCPPKIGVTTWKRRLDTVVAEQQLLYTLGADYVDCLRQAGAVPLLLPATVGDEIDSVLDVLDGLLISGGADVDPASYGQEPAGARDWNTDWDASDVALIRAAGEIGLPTFGICRGLQIMNVACGGTLRQEVTGETDAHPPRSPDRVAALAYRHDVELRPGSQLAEIFAATSRPVTSLHHQGIDRLAEGFAVSATAPDGLIEGIERTDDGWPALAVQWHPEKMDGLDAPLFEAFVALASEHGE